MTTDNSTIGILIIVSFILLSIAYCIRRRYIRQQLSELEPLKITPNNWA